VVTNHVANMKLAVGGIFPYPRARAAGVELGLGTDGPGSNNSLDLLADAKAFALLQKHAGGDPAIVTAAETFQIATGSRSSLVGGVPIEPGARADFVLVRSGAAELTPGELIANLVYAASGSVVDTTVVAGAPLMRGGVIDGASEVVARARERAGGLGLTAS
jgi:5-methylthioadenosine/S-adenosylhomocysteine deaminase